MSKARMAPPIGTNVLWYRGGDVKGDPIAAIVTGSNQHGHATLHCFQPMRAIPLVYDGVRHKDDPWFTDVPKHAEKRDKARQARGVWSFLVDDMPSRLPEKAAPPQQTVLSPEEHQKLAAERKPRQDGRRSKK